MSLSKLIEMHVTMIVLFLGHLQQKLHVFPMIRGIHGCLYYLVLTTCTCIMIVFFLSIFILADVTKYNFELIGVIGTYPFVT